MIPRDIFAFPYIDRVQINYSYWFIHDVSEQEYQRVVKALLSSILYRKSGFRGSNSGRAVFRDHTKYHGLASLRYNRDTRNLALSMSVSFNVLSIVAARYVKEPVGLEHESLNDKSNYLPSYIIEDIGYRTISSRCIEVLIEEIDRLQSMVASAVHDAIPSLIGKIGHPQISIESIELGNDIPCENALLWLKDNEQSLKACFNKSRVQRYGPEEVIDDNALGFQFRTWSNEVLRVYSKTQKTLRIEVELKKQRLQYCAGSNRLIDLRRDWIMSYIQQLVESANRTVGEIRSGVSVHTQAVPYSRREVFEFIKLCKDYNTFFHIVSILATTGRVKYRKSLAHTLRKLTQAGLLTRGRKGVYACPRELTESLEWMIRDSRLFQLIQNGRGCNLQ